MEPSGGHQHSSTQTLWPVGLAVGFAVFLVGFVVSWSVVAVGAIIAVIFAALWIRDVTRGSSLAAAPEAFAPETRANRQTDGHAAALAGGGTGAPVSRAYFLEASTLGLGAVIGGLVTLPVLGFMIGPAFTKQGVPPTDLGPLSDYPVGQYVITTFTADPSQGFVSRRTAFVRYNGLLGSTPSFTILSSRCVHLGCPVQPNGIPKASASSHFKDVSQVPVTPSGFGCPCHDSQYDNEGNRTSGPAVRALDRFEFSIVNGHLVVGSVYSVAYVKGTGAQAQIYKVPYAFPGEHVSGLESWLYPVQPPH